MMNKKCSCSREQLLQNIHEVSFAVNDIHLFLNTHPECQEALEYYKEKVMERKKLMKEYAETFGPLTIEDAWKSGDNCWKWITEAFPWEKGACK